MQALLDRSYAPFAFGAAAAPCSEFLATGYGSAAGAMCNVEGCFKKGAPLTIKAVISSHGHARAVKHLEALEKLAPGAGASRIAMDKHKKRPQPPSKQAPGVPRALSELHDHLTAPPGGSPARAAASAAPAAAAAPGDDLSLIHI